MEIAPDPQSPQISTRMAGAYPRRHLICPEKSRCPAAGKSGTPASDRHSSALREEAPAFANSRPSSLGLAVPHLDGVAFVAGHRQAGNRRCLATQCVSPFLDVEDPERQARAAIGSTRDSRTHPADEHRQSRLGSAAHSRRATEARHQYWRNQRKQISRAKSQAAVPDVAHFPRESRQQSCIRRLLHCANDPVSGSVCVSRAGA
jgi:hypothetical protein